jgi:hypothetical protein
MFSMLIVEYPAAARSCWTCIQKAVYGLASDSDIISNRLQLLDNTADEN